VDRARQTDSWTTRTSAGLRQPARLPPRGAAQEQGDRRQDPRIHGRGAQGPPRPDGQQGQGAAHPRGNRRRGAAHPQGAARRHDQLPRRRAGLHHRPRQGSRRIARLGPFGNNIKPIEDYLFSAEEGQISDPVKTPHGWALLIVDRRRPASRRSNAAVREAIKQRLEMRALREIGAEHAERT